MAQDKIRRTKSGVVITPEDYQAYQKIRKNRAQTNRKAREDFAKSLNLSYSETLIAKRLKERQGKRFTINDFRSQYDFEQFMASGLKYADFDEYKRRKAYDYMYHMRGAFKELSSDDPEIMSRYDEIIEMLDDPYLLDEIYSQSEELDLSFVYVEAKEGNIERLNYTLDVLEELIKKANARKS